ncbi:MAG: hypothetical protein R3C59_16125 [Planctomycetaceae bacterium]
MKSPDIHARIANRMTRVVFKMVAGRQIYRHPSRLDRGYVMDKLLTFYREHTISPAVTVRDLKFVADHLQKHDQREEGEKLREAALKAQRSRRKGPQELGTLLVGEEKGDAAHYREGTEEQGHALKNKEEQGRRRTRTGIVIIVEQANNGLMNEIFDGLPAAAVQVAEFLDAARLCHAADFRAFRGGHQLQCLSFFPFFPCSMPVLVLLHFRRMAISQFGGRLLCADGGLGDGVA